jgi:hypothetical protein
LMASGAASDLPWYQFMADDGSQPGVGAWFGLAAGVRAQQQRPTYVLSGLADVVPPIRLSARLARAQRSAKGVVSVALRRRWRRRGVRRMGVRQHSLEVTLGSAMPHLAVSLRLSSKPSTSRAWLSSKPSAWMAWS